MSAPGAHRWLTVEVERGVVHVIPLDDVVPHDRIDDCLCGPTSECIPKDNGPDGWVVTHHSLDGREANEPSNNTPEVPL
jgi:hypothetical protein